MNLPLSKNGKGCEKSSLGKDNWEFAVLFVHVKYEVSVNLRCQIDS